MDFGSLLLTQVLFALSLQEMYINRNTVEKAFWNAKDPRTYPRSLVLGGTAVFFVVTTYQGLRYRAHHLEPETKNSMLGRDRTETPNRVTRALKEGPIIMNQKRYNTLKHEGLGVDHEEWKKGKMSEYTNRTSTV